MKNSGPLYSIALDIENGERTHISRAMKTKKYTCPHCGSRMIPKLGRVKRHHYAHIPDAKCDPWYSNKGEWHIEMQEMFDEEHKYMERRVDADDGEWHVADICIEKPCGQKLVIEFQHSEMTEKEFIERTYFWKIKVGADIIWVFDYSQNGVKKQNRFQQIPDEPHTTGPGIFSEYVRYKWRRPAKTVSPEHPFDSVPILFYMNAEENCEWVEYEKYDKQSLRGKYNPRTFYLLVQSMTPYDTEESGISGARICGKKFVTSSFGHYILSDRYDSYAAPRIPEIERITVKTKDAFQNNYIRDVCGVYFRNRPADKKTRSIKMSVFGGYSEYCRFPVEDNGVSEKDLAFIRSVAGDDNVLLEHVWQGHLLGRFGAKPSQETGETRYRNEYGGIVIYAAKEKFDEYVQMYSRKESDNWLLTTAIIKETGIAEYMYLPISSDEFYGVKNNTVERRELACRQFPEEDVHCPEMMICGMTVLPSITDEIEMLRMPDYSEPDKGFEVVLAEGCFLPNERHVRMRVSSIKIPYERSDLYLPIRSPHYMDYGIIMGSAAMWNNEMDMHYIRRFFCQYSKEPNVIA